MKKTLNFLPFTLFAVLAGVIAGTAAKQGLPQDTEHLAIYLSVAVMGLLAWVVQRIVEQQARMAETLDNHLSEIGKGLSLTTQLLLQRTAIFDNLERQAEKSNEALALIAQNLTQLHHISSEAVPYMASTKDQLDQITNRLLDAIIVPTKKTTKAALEIQREQTKQKNHKDHDSNHSNHASE